MKEINKEKIIRIIYEMALLMFFMILLVFFAVGFQYQMSVNKQKTLDFSVWFIVFMSITIISKITLNVDYKVDRKYKFKDLMKHLQENLRISTDGKIEIITPLEFLSILDDMSDFIGNNLPC